MPEIEPLKMLKVYLVSPDALNDNARAGLPDCIMDAMGPVTAYTERQGIAMLMGRIELPEGYDKADVLDKLCACACNGDSDFYSPGYMKVMREIYPLKRNIVAWLTRHTIANELEGFRGLSRQERVNRETKFKIRHKIYDKGTRTITVSQNSRKSDLEGGLRRTLNGMKKDELIKLYEEDMRQDSRETVEEEPVGGTVTIQMSMF